MSINYNFINSEKQLSAFIDFLPDLKQDEVYYVCILARSKYSPNFKADSQIKSFYCKKELIIEKIRQLECKLGCYKFNNLPIPQESLSVYINPNPRDLRKSIKACTKSFMDILEKTPLPNLSSTLMSSVQTHSSKNRFIDFDFDKVSLEDILNKIRPFINKEALSWVVTKGGFHLLVEISKVAETYKKSWFKKISSLPGCDTSSDKLLPLPGCSQSDFTPFHQQECFSEIIEKISAAGFKIVNILDTPGEFTYLFETKEDATRAYHTFERDIDGNWIRKIVGWWEKA